MQENEDLPDNAPQPRLCHIVKWIDFDGYGFNLHADKSKAGQYIGKVDQNSPAETAGLKEYDRIIEINGVNISNENHKQAVQRIKSLENETKLLVVDIEADKWYKEHNTIVKSDQSNVLFGTSKLEDIVADTGSETASHVSTNGNYATEDIHSISSQNSFQNENSVQITMSPIDSPQDVLENIESTKDEEKNVAVSKAEKSELNLNMTVAEMRAQLSARKKTDPRNDGIDIKKKFRIIQNM